MTISEITIRTLTLLEEMDAAVDLQKQYWGTDLESLVPAHMLFTIASAGGHVLGAFDGSRMVGVLIGLIGTNTAVVDRPAMANLLIASKRMVVLPEYRNAGVGYRLKLAQRAAAIRQGIRLVTWTYDPLLAPNAHLNLRKLGCISREYWVDYYGTDPTSTLVTLGSSDRLPVEWWVTHRRVEERLNEKRSALTLQHYVDAEATVLNPADMEGLWLYPSTTVTPPVGTFALLEIPPNYALMIQDHPELAREWRAHTRELFTEMLRGGYYVADFLRGALSGRERNFYLFSYDGSGVDFRMN